GTPDGYVGAGEIPGRQRGKGEFHCDQVGGRLDGIQQIADDGLPHAFLRSGRHKALTHRIEYCRRPAGRGGFRIAVHRLRGQWRYRRPPVATNHHMGTISTMSRIRENQAPPASWAPSISKHPQAMPKSRKRACERAIMNMTIIKPIRAPNSFSHRVRMMPMPTTSSKADSHRVKPLTMKPGRSWYWATSVAKLLGSRNLGRPAAMNMIPSPSRRTERSKGARGKER